MVINQVAKNIIYFVQNHFYKLRPSLISIYIIREQMPAMAAGVVFFTFVFIINKVIILLSLLLEKNVPAKYSLELFLLMLPFSMALTVPIAILMATIMAMGRLSSDSEVIAMRASGISYYSIYRSLIFMGFLYTVFMILFNNYVLPFANYRYRVLYDEIARSQPVTLLDEGVFNTIPGTKQTIYAHKIDKKQRIMYQVIIYRENRKKGIDVIHAKKGKWLNPKEIVHNKSAAPSTNRPGVQTLRLFHGYLHSPDASNAQYTMIDFSQKYMDIHIEEKGIGSSQPQAAKSEREKGMVEIYTDLQKFEKKHSGSREPRIQEEIAYRKLEFWKHLSIPSACLALTLIGAPLGIVSHRSGRGMGFGLAVVVSFVYYLLLMTGERAVRALQLDPFVGAWLPVVFISIIGVLLIYFRNSFENLMEAMDAVLKKIFIKKQ